MKHNADTQHDGEVVFESANARVIDCLGCGYRHVDPLPAAADIQRLYGGEYYEVDKPGMFDAYWRSLDWFNQMYDDRYDYFEAHVTQRRVLDIGAGAGFFLRRGKERGWETLGVEPSKTACRYASDHHGVKMIDGLFEELDHSVLGTFGAINLSEVLEHVVSPRRVLQGCHQLLVEDGVLFVMVPNDFNPLQEVYMQQNKQAEQYWVVPTHHYNYFDQETIVRLIEAVGFRVTYTEVSFPMELFLLAGLDYVTDREGLGRKCHDGVKSFELALGSSGKRSIKRELYHRLSEINLGRDLMIYAKTSWSAMY